MAPRNGRHPAGWYLEGYLDEEGTYLVRIPVRTFPFTIGRRADQSLCLHSSGVSSHHAELVEDGDHLRVLDCGSTNGTFVNRQRIGDAGVRLRDGDVLHVARMELRLMREHENDLAENTATTTIEALNLPRHFFHNIRAFQRMLDERDVRIYFQPIVSLSDYRKVSAWEALGRVSAPGLPATPNELFEIARQINAEEVLSRILRDEAVRAARRLPGAGPTVFINSRPAEAADPSLLGSLERLVRANPDVHLVLEIHEGAITDVGRMRHFSERLADIGVQLAYDDFGAGQARLLELADAPPAYLKFDRSLCSDLHKASNHKLQMLRTLVEMVQDFGIIPVAEGIEEEAEARACEDVGFRLGQGFLFGRPAPPEHYARGNPNITIPEPISSPEYD